MAKILSDWEGGNEASERSVDSSEAVVVLGFKELAFLFQMLAGSFGVAAMLALVEKAHARFV